MAISGISFAGAYQTTMPAQKVQQNNQLNKEQYEAERKKNNQHVIDHENQHLAAAGQFAFGGIHIDYDENGWATGGHVNVKMPTLDKSNPEKTVHHAQTIMKSAMAPSDPSDQDYKVYSQASRVMFQAQQLLAQNKQGNNNSNQKSAQKA